MDWKLTSLETLTTDREVHGSISWIVEGRSYVSRIVEQLKLLGAVFSSVGHAMAAPKHLLQQAPKKFFTMRQYLMSPEIDIREKFQENAKLQEYP